MEEKIEEKDVLLLLTKADTILEKYDYAEKLKENFNIFEILGLENLEVDLHSFFIFSLIKNPKKNNLHENFFKYFLEIVLKEEYNPSKKYWVFREHKIPNGRLDFYIKTDDKEYAVEMKIGAVDSENQLKKYQEFLASQNKKNKLYYLTLFGDEPVQEENKKTNPVLISFKEDVSKWIKKCIEKSYDYPKTRETLKQYLFTINKLTNNLQDEEKEMEIKELLLKDNNLKVAMELSKSIEDVKEEVEEKFWEELMNKIDIPLERDTYFEDYPLKEINFYKEINLKDKLLCFGLGRGKNNIYFFIGFTNREYDEWISPDFSDELNNKFIEFQEKTSNLKGKYKTENDYSVWKYIQISQSANFNTDDFYILLDTEQKNDLIAELNEYMQGMYQTINEVFDK